jgi:outer membrane protein TolC
MKYRNQSTWLMMVLFSGLGAQAVGAAVLSRAAATTAVPATTSTTEEEDDDEADSAEQDVAQGILPPEESATTATPAVRPPRFATLTRDRVATSFTAARSPAARTPAATLTMGQCRALATQRNLALRQVELEEFSKLALSESYKVQELPRFIGSGELSRRNNFAFSFSEILGRSATSPTPGGTGVDQFSRAHDKNTWRYSLETRWSPTDALLANYLKKNAQNDATKERLMRVRIGQKLMGVVEASYQRLLALQAMKPLTQQLLEQRQDLVKKSQVLFQERMTLVEDLHRVNVKLMQVLGLATSVNNEMGLQREYLGSAMRIRPDELGAEVLLTGEQPVPGRAESFEQLEKYAVSHRPEAYLAGLDHLNAANDFRRTSVKQYPKITAFGRFSRDIDRHLLNDDWTEVGGYVYFDVIDLAANSKERRAARYRREKSKSEIESVGLGIATQVREAALRYKAALADVDTAAQLLESAANVRNILKQRVEVGAQNTLSLLEAEGDVLQETISHRRAVGEAHARLADLRAATGVNFRTGLPR